MSDALDSAGHSGQPTTTRLERYHVHLSGSIRIQRAQAVASRYNYTVFLLDVPVIYAYSRI